MLIELIRNKNTLPFDYYKEIIESYQNEISGIISILTPIMFIIIKELKNKCDEINKKKDKLLELVMDGYLENNDYISLSDNLIFLLSFNSIISSLKYS